MATRFRARLSSPPEVGDFLDFGERTPEGFARVYSASWSSVGDGVYDVEVPGGDCFVAEGMSFIAVTPGSRFVAGRWTIEGRRGDILEVVESAPAPPAAFPRGDALTEALKPLVEVWALTHGWHRWRLPATGDAIATLHDLGAPAELVGLYELSDGFHLFDGSLEIWSVQRIAERAREPDPDELLRFADDGSEDDFGIWRADGCAPIVLIAGELEESPEKFAIVGTDLASFLQSETLANVRELGHRPALEALAFGSADAAPAMHARQDPYERRVDAAELRRHLDAE